MSDMIYTDEMEEANWDRLHEAAEKAARGWKFLGAEEGGNMWYIPMPEGVWDPSVTVYFEGVYAHHKPETPFIAEVGDVPEGEEAVRWFATPEEAIAWAEAWAAPYLDEGKAPPPPPAPKTPVRDRRSGPIVWEPTETGGLRAVINEHAVLTVETLPDEADLVPAARERRERAMLWDNGEESIHQDCRTRESAKKHAAEILDLWAQGF